MKWKDCVLRQIESDLGLNARYIKGQDTPVRNCWHYDTDGKSVEMMFYDELDFKAGMNLIFILAEIYGVVILAFSLMDTHVHFALWGTEKDCDKFIHEYIRRLSILIVKRHNLKQPFYHIIIGRQTIKTASYLKKVICYIHKNAPAGGLRYNAYDYPWSSGPLLFRNSGNWASPRWTYAEFSSIEGLNVQDKRAFMRSKKLTRRKVRTIDSIVFPGEYVAYELTERLFGSCRALNYFMSTTKESDIEAMGGTISNLSIPIQEMRVHKFEVCQELFGHQDIRKLDTSQRLRLAKTLKARYDSSPKQIARLCGLIYNEIKDLL